VGYFEKTVQKAVSSETFGRLSCCGVFVPIVNPVTAITAGVLQMTNIRTTTPRNGGDHVQLENKGMRARDIRGHVGCWHAFGAGIGDPGVTE
jgi:hypothetical protein